MNGYFLQSLRRMSVAFIAICPFYFQLGHAADMLDDSYRLTPTPDWVIPVEPAHVTAEADIVGGERFLLVDRQSFDDGTTVAFHHHSVTEVVGQAGLSDNSKLVVTFDPGYQRLELHSATVWRDGRQSDRLKRAHITVARTEDGNNLNLLNGEVTALVVLPDVRVGDQVEIRYTVHGRNPVFDSRHDSSWRVRWGTPVDRSVLRITVPQFMNLSHTPRPEATFSETVSAGLRSLQWQWDGLESSEAEKKTTRWYPHPDRLEVTAFQSWQEVGDWGAALFAGHPSDGDHYRRLSQSIHRIADSQGLDRAIAMAIDHVQKRIRYYGLELGENSHRPHAPDVVLKNGYGDCKDKALLLVTLLRDLDVKAWPLLVSTRFRRGIADRLPRPGIFNHVIVLVEQAGEQYWIDATDTSQSGLLGFRGQPEYGAGLVLGKPDESLVLRKALLPEQPDITTHDSFYLSSIGGPVDFLTTTIYRGSEANWFRRKLDENGRRRMQEQYLEYYENLYGRLHALDAVQVAEDKLANTITVTEGYRLSKFWEVDVRSRQAEFDVYAYRLRGMLDDFSKVKRHRKAPLRIDGPARSAYRIQFFPNVASPERELEEASFAIDGFSYRDSEYVLGDSLVFDSELVIATDELDVNLLSEYNKFRERVMRRAQSGRYYRLLHPDQIQLGENTTALLNELGALHP